MVVYEVVHRFDVDGGFGDAIGGEETFAIFASKKDAEDCVRKYSNPHVYDKPYDELWCGELNIREIYVIPEEEYISGWEPEKRKVKMLESRYYWW